MPNSGSEHLITFAPAFAALVLALVHVFANRLRFLEGVPRSRWLSAAGGVSVAYVFIHLLPELGEGQATIEGAVRGAFGFLEHHAYLVALTGLVVFYGLERAAKESRRRSRDARGGDETGAGVFRLHVASFSLYNAIIGYLLVHRAQPGPVGLVFYAVAMGLHFLVTDYGLREHHRAAYLRVGRWILAGAVIAGFVGGLTFEVHEVGVELLRAFLAGGVILNVLKEELPEERESRFAAFVLGAGGYAAVLVAL